MLDSIKALTYPLEVRNYNAESYSLCDLDGLPNPGADMKHDYVFANVRVSGEAIQVYSLFETLPTERRPRVVATSRLANADAWYLFASSELYPVIGRVRLEGSDPLAVSFGGYEEAVKRDPKTGANIEYNGVTLPATHSVGYNVLSRVGVCKFTKT